MNGIGERRLAMLVILVTNSLGLTCHEEELVAFDSLWGSSKRGQVMAALVEGIARLMDDIEFHVDHVFQLLSSE